MKTQAVVLLSGGLDSVFNLYLAHKEWSGDVVCLCLNYGQKAWEQELSAAQFFTSELKVPLQVIDITKIFQGGKSSLTSVEHSVPTDEVNIESEQASVSSAEKVWVPNRNGVFLNIAACEAEKLEAQWIVPGFNAEEAATFPDNSIEYIEKVNACLKLSTANGVQVKCFSQSMNKVDIIKGLDNMGVNLDQIWSCYKNGSEICGECESCQRFCEQKRPSLRKIMEALWLKKSFQYDGSQLKPLHNYLEYGVLGDSVVSWRGACDIPFEHMIDGEDLKESAQISGDDMIHLVLEMFDMPLVAAVAFQRLIGELLLADLKKQSDLAQSMVRKGDDLYLDSKKFNISIATCSATSSLIHFGFNCRNSGTPVETCALEDFGISDPESFAQSFMESVVTEFKAIKRATMKVRSF